MSAADNDPRQIWDWDADDERKDRRDSILAFFVPLFAVAAVVVFLVVVNS